MAAALERVHQEKCEQAVCSELQREHKRNSECVTCRGGQPAPGPKVERVNENISVRKLFVVSSNARTNVTVCCFYRWQTSPGPEVERAKRDHKCTKTVRGDPDT